MLSSSLVQVEVEVQFGVEIMDELLLIIAAKNTFLFSGFVGGWVG